MAMESSACPIHVISLGCPKNRVDTERFLQKLKLPIRFSGEIENSKLVLLNTCAFIEPASRESVRTILELIERINKLPIKPLLVVMGCLPARYTARELKKEFPEIDFLLLNPDDDNTILEISRSLRNTALPYESHIDFGRRSYAYVKIAEGCNHHCSFCTIPNFKGAYHSQPLSAVIGDAENLLKNGVKELILVAQDLLSWGVDLPDSPDFIYLLKRLADLEGVHWLRLLYLYPTLITDEFLAFIRERGEPLLPYFDVPFQHSEQTILKKMGRPFGKDPRAVIERIRKHLPDAAIRTTLITGFPGETEKDFQNLCEFVEESAFAHLGVFTYYAEEGTRAAEMPDQLPEEIKEERRKILLELQAPISEAFLTRFRSTDMQIIVDESDFDEWPGLYKGRVWFQAPEIDGITYISGENLKIGAIARGEIMDSAIYDLSALAISDVI